MFINKLLYHMNLPHVKYFWWFLAVKKHEFLNLLLHLHSYKDIKCGFYILRCFSLQCELIVVLEINKAKCQLKTYTIFFKGKINIFSNTNFKRPKVGIQWEYIIFLFSIVFLESVDNLTHSLDITFLSLQNIKRIQIQHP